MSQVFPASFLRQLNLLSRSKSPMLRQPGATLPAESGRRSKRGQQQRGHEVAGYRAYTPGDDPRHVDWNASARSDGLQIRQFQEHERQNLVVLLDGSPSTLARSATALAIRRCAAVALCMAQQQGMSAEFCDRGHMRKSGASYENDLRDTLAWLCAVREPASPAWQQPFGSASLGQLRRRMDRGTRVLALTDGWLPVQDAAGLASLREQGLHCSLVMLPAREDLHPSMSGDLELHSAEHAVAESPGVIELTMSYDARQHYLRLVREHFESWQRLCADLRIPLVHAASDDAQGCEDLMALVRRALGGALA